MQDSENAGSLTCAGQCCGIDRHPTFFACPMPVKSLDTIIQPFLGERCRQQEEFSKRLVNNSEELLAEVEWSDVEALAISSSYTMAAFRRVQFGKRDMDALSPSRTS